MAADRGLPDLRRRHEARPHQPVLDQLTDPGRVDHVALAAGDVMQMPGVQKPALKARLERVRGQSAVRGGLLSTSLRYALEAAVNGSAGPRAMLPNELAASGAIGVYRTAAAFSSNSGGG